MSGLVSVKWSIETCYETSYGFYLSAVGTDGVIACGRDVNLGWTLTQYNLLTGEVRATARLGGIIKGMTTVVLNERICIALSDRYIWVLT